MKSTTRRHLMALAGFAATLAAMSKAGRADSETQTIAPEFTGKKLRVIGPGQMVTMDYSDQRVNIEVDEEHIIKRVYIG